MNSIAESSTSTTPCHRLVIGAMSGTSLDGIDVVLVDIVGKGLQIQVKFLKHLSFPFDDLISKRLRLVAEQNPCTAGEFASLANDLGTVYASACVTVAKECNVFGSINLVSLHGQTLYHKPPLTLQLINAQPIAQSLGCDIVYDLRSEDVFLGGQGAPLTPLADFILFRKTDKRRAVINLGGFANVTFLPSTDSVDSVTGCDVCACNQILDYCSRKVLNKPFDSNGEISETGVVNTVAYDDLITLLQNASLFSRSLGTGDELTLWTEKHCLNLQAEDLLATAAEGIAYFIGHFVYDKADEVIIAGGGSKHCRLVKALSKVIGKDVIPSDSLGIPASAREALCWAVLGCLAKDGVNVALRSVTQTPNDKISKHLSGSWILQR